MTALVALHDVHVDHYGAKMLRGVTWTLREGEHWAILGPNGAGKSSLLKLIAGEIWPHHDGGGRRVYNLDGQETESPIVARKCISLLSAETQERYRRHRWDMTGLAAILSGRSPGPWFQGEPTEELVGEAREAAKLTHALDLLDKSTLEMSEGEARRVLLARAIFSQPRILLLDECLNGLDRHSRHPIRRAIEELMESGIQLVMTSHRPGEMPSQLTHQAGMREGRIHSTALWEARGEIKPQAAHGNFAVRSREDHAPLVEVLNADVVIAGNRILHDINWCLYAGECHVVSGANGSGKSTFLRLVTGDQPPYHGGDVRWMGSSEGWTRGDRMGLFGVVSLLLQEEYDPDVPLLDVVTSGWFSTTGLHCEPTRDQVGGAREMLDQLGLSGLASKPFGSLSFGERRRGLLGRAIVHGPPILVLDEPTNGLDGGSLETFMVLLEREHARGTAMLYITHHEEEVPPFATHRHEMVEGRLRQVSPMDEVHHRERRHALR
ncbi:MAG: ATP-binding cassette domain-containing protein [Candidatus Sumerlaeia bacterium]|nr:ATP-binding cassette domain-containing protein [Candidatus Sumerlaeia bacterium]